MEESLPQEAEACPAIHHTFDRFELVDLAFCWTLTPGLTQRLPNGIVIALNTDDETLELGNAALASFLHPRA